MSIRVIIEPVQPLFDFSDLLVRLRDLPNLIEVLRVEDPRTIEFTPPDPIGKEDEEKPTRFSTIAFDRQSGHAARIAGEIERFEEVEIEPTRFEPLPTGEELEAAREILAQDPDIGRRIESGELLVYQPMPPLASRERDDGLMERLISLATYRESDDPPHVLYAINIGNRLVIRHPDWIVHWPAFDCESHLPVGVYPSPIPGGPDRVRVRVLDDETELWNLIVVRPRASEPSALGKGSGVELRNVRYRGRLVFYQAHVPILNVLYDDGTTYRDWQNDETAFEAIGNDPVGPGWRLCSQPPRTILESHDDAGNNFQGVALWYEDGELRLVSEMQAGWYRYISDWRLLDNGTIRPRFGFAGTRNPMTCKRHQHHVYWRLDFDIEGAGQDVVEQRSLILSADFVNGIPVIANPWQPIRTETKRKRSWFASRWRVRDLQQNRGYFIEPGGMDGTADAFGVSDLWILRYHGNELDDGVSTVGGTPNDTIIKIDKYLTGEWIEGADVVVWYAGHFIHDEHDPHPHQGHIVGPELRPFNW
jgi:hypothetical protein